MGFILWTYRLVAWPIWVGGGYVVLMASCHQAVVHSDDPATRELAYWLSNVASFGMGALIF